MRWAVPSGFTRYFTADLPQLVREHPGLALKLLSGASMVELARGEADLALRASPLVDPELVARKLGEAGFALYGSIAMGRWISTDSTIMR